MIADNSAASSLDLMKMTGITFTPAGNDSTTKTATVVITHTYNAGGGNPQGNYAWGFGMAGHYDPPAGDNVVSNRLQLTGTGTFPGSTPASISLGGVDTGVLATPTTSNLNGSITKSKAAVVVKPNCNTGSARCAPTISQTFTITVKGNDTLKLTDSVICAGGTCRQVDQVIPIAPQLYALMLKLDPRAPNDINKLSAWLAQMGEKYLTKPTQKKLLANLILELDKWLAKTVPGTCPELEAKITQEIINPDIEAELANCGTPDVCVPAGDVPPEETNGMITINKHLNDACTTNNECTPLEFHFSIEGVEPLGFLLTLDVPTDISGNGSSSVPVPAGTYKVSEHPLTPGWIPTTAVCNGDGPTTGVVLRGDDNVTCDFVNSPVLIGLGDIPDGGFGSAALGVSSDGSVVVGHGLGVNGQEASRWTAGTGMVDITPHGFGEATAASSDGSVVVGFMHNFGVPFAFRWTTDSGFEDLGTLLSAGVGTSEASAVSADGNVVVGSSLHSSPIGGVIEAFRWTPTGGMVGLGGLAGGHGAFLSRATAVSADGSVIVGYASGGVSGQQLFRWTSTGGMQGVDNIVNAQPTAVSGDGSVIVGQLQQADGLFYAFHWSVTSALEILPGLGGTLGELRSIATDVSNDGSVIVGRAVSPEDNEAVIWRKVNGSWTVQTLEAAVGSTNSRLITAEGISADGRTIVGNAATLFGVNRSEGYRIILPE